ncbi:helix-turn-helix domain-containing protein [Sphingobium sp. MK2]|uniref:helix-turn-helix domain-containing protein n=1 Tax=Sphingobium sp. MK2 TaxID=3116540 RepID=UPI0032E35B01
MLSFTIGRSTITVFIDGSIATIDDSHANYVPLLAELRKPPEERDLIAIEKFSTIKKMLASMNFGPVTVTEVEVLFEGSPVGSYLAKRMLEIFNDGIDITPYAAFMVNVLKNPAGYIHQELYEWMEKAQLPITPDGHFIAFKKVRRNYKDCHSGLFDNSVGTLLEMDREACDTNRHRTCSTGFHFCSASYLPQFGGERVMVVKINPADVTSIPSDYAFAKGRTCRYEVIAELSAQSEAYSKAWSAAIVDFENPAELPLTVLQVPVEASDPDEIIQTTVMPPEKIVKQRSVKKMDVAAEVKEAVKKIPAAVQGKTFTTSDNRVFTKKQVKKAIADNVSNRGAARALGIGESTLRGWIKKL